MKGINGAGIIAVANNDRRLKIRRAVAQTRIDAGLWRVCGFFLR
jgi:hypothetical protein